MWGVRMKTSSQAPANSFSFNLNSPAKQHLVNLLNVHFCTRKIGVFYDPIGVSGKWPSKGATNINARHKLGARLAPGDER